VRGDRTQRNVVKQAASGLAARALNARLTDAKTLVNEPSGEGGHKSVHVMVRLQDIENFAPLSAEPCSADADVVQLISPGA
jgi:hypothetical protein